MIVAWKESIVAAEIYQEESVVFPGRQDQDIAWNMSASHIRLLDIPGTPSH